MDEYADETHQGQHGPGAGRRPKGLTPEANDQEQDEGAEGEAAEDDGGGRKLLERRLRGDEGEPPHDGGRAGRRASDRARPWTLLVVGHVRTMICGARSG